MKDLHKILLLAVIVISGCMFGSKTEPQLSFCYWKTNLDFSPDEIILSKSMNVNHLYLRYFDVDWNAPLKMAVPVGKLQHNYHIKLPTNNISPAVYITNLALNKTPHEQLPHLANKICDKIKNTNNRLKQAYLNAMGENILNYEKYNYSPPDSIIALKDSLVSNYEREWNTNFDEVLIDCDWTEQNSKKFFALIEKIKNNFPHKTVTVTLRLWQYKHREKSGIPPADRCLLMCYNMNNPREFSSQNSIASYNDLSPYLENSSDYPIPLDIALPSFSWAVLYRGGKFKRIINGISEQLIAKDSITYKKLKDNTYMYQRDTVYGNTYIRNGDILKTELVTKKELSMMVKQLSSLKKDDKQRITFFDWDTLQIQYYGKESFKNFTATFN